MDDSMYHWREIGANWLWHFETPLFTAKVVKVADGWESEVNPMFTPSYRQFFKSDTHATRESAIEAAEHVLIDIAESIIEGVIR
jgi:hypothetical protein